MKLEAEFGDDVTVLLIESQGATPEKMESFALQQKWLLAGGIWTTEQPFQTGSGSLPHTVVLGIDGEVLFNDRPSSAVENLVSEQIKLAKKGPKGLSPACAKAWVEFEKGGYATAIAALEAVQDGPEKEAARKLAASLTTRAKAKVARLAWLLENAEFEKADKLAPLLVKGLAGHATLEPKATELAAKLVAKEIAPERDAAKAFDKIEKKIAKDGLDPSALKQLAGLVEKFRETRAGKRAAHMLKVVEG